MSVARTSVRGYASVTRPVSPAPGLAPRVRREAGGASRPPPSSRPTYWPRVRLREPKSRETLKKVLGPGQEIPQGLRKV